MAVVAPCIAARLVEAARASDKGDVIDRAATTLQM